MPRCSFVALSLVLSVVAVACGGSSNGAGGNDGGGGAGGASAACNTTANSAAMITEMQVAENSVPPFTGGTVLPGTYHLVSVTVYTGTGGATGPNGVTHKNTAVMTAGAGTAFTEELVSQDNNGGAEYRATFSVTPAGTMLAFSYTCPTGNGFMLPYTVSGEQITLAVGVGRVEVWTRQP